jgi:hypothetical protein
MSSTMMMERTGVALPGISLPGMGAPAVGAPTGVPPAANWLMVPRCTYKFEKCPGGMKITCSCEDKVSCSMVQNLCAMLAGGMCGYCVMLNGMTVCSCNLVMGLCKCEPTEEGVSVTCTSGDPKCCEMIQACCDYLCSMVEAGCTCCLLMSNTPVCCGGCEPAKTSAKPAKAAR